MMRFIKSTTMVIAGICWLAFAVFFCVFLYQYLVGGAGLQVFGFFLPSPSFGTKLGWVITASAARFDYPLGLTVGEDGAVYVGDTSNYAIRRGLTGASLPNNLYPVAQCKTVFVLSDSNGLADAWVDNGSYDPDGDQITISASPASPYPVGTPSQLDRDRHQFLYRHGEGL